jgi:hypothetical protein
MSHTKGEKRDIVYKQKRIYPLSAFIVSGKDMCPFLKGFSGPITGV